MKLSQIALAGAAATTVLSGFGSGFGLYEASSKGYALGGAVLGRACDASANFYNPATLTDLTNVTVTVGFMTEHPRGRIKVNGLPSEPMNSGVFMLPHFHLAVPLPFDLTFGLGLMPEYGLGSAYDDTWRLAYSSTETTVQSFTANPNLAYRITDKWSVGAGLRFTYFDFEQYSYPAVMANPFRPGQYFRFGNRLKGDNGMKDFGYQVGTKYDVFDNFSVGLVYKSLTVVNVDGKTGNSALPSGLASVDRQLAAAAAAKSGAAATDLELPQSITGGFNWDLTDTVHLGGSLAWTQWSSVDTLIFNLAGDKKLLRFNWKDTWRAGIAPSWDFAEDWTAIMSYVFENDCSADQESTMLPAADRHMLSWGLCWSCWRNLEIDLVYGMILMDGKVTQTRHGVTGELECYKAYRGISHAAGLTLTYRF